MALVGTGSWRMAWLVLGYIERICGVCIRVPLHWRLQALSTVAALVAVDLVRDGICISTRACQLHNHRTLATRPADKKDPYVPRCCPYGDGARTPELGPGGCWSGHSPGGGWSGGGHEFPEGERPGPG